MIQSLRTPMVVEVSLVSQESIKPSSTNLKPRDQHKLFQMGVQINPDVKDVIIPIQEKTFWSIWNDKLRDQLQMHPMSKLQDMQRFRSSTRHQYKGRSWARDDQRKDDQTCTKQALKVYNQQLNKLNKSGNHCFREEIARSRIRWIR